MRCPSSVSRATPADTLCLPPSHTPVFLPTLPPGYVGPRRPCFLLNHSPPPEAATRAPTHTPLPCCPTPGLSSRPGIPPWPSCKVSTWLRPTGSQTCRQLGIPMGFQCSWDSWARPEWWHVPPGALVRGSWVVNLAMWALRWLLQPVSAQRESDLAQL